MTEAELLDRTRTLVQQANLPAAMGLGTTWIIVLAHSPFLPPVAAERYEATLKEYQQLFPQDAVDFSQPKRDHTTRYLLLRVGSPAVSRWLSQGS
jgi:hypothetical protein